MDALNGEPIPQQEEKPVEEVRLPGMGDALLSEPAEDSPLFDGKVASQADDFWLNNKSTNSKKKEGKKMIWSDE